MDLAANFVSLAEALENECQFLRPEGVGVGFGWQAQDLNEQAFAATLRRLTPLSARRSRRRFPTTSCDSSTKLLGVRSSVAAAAILFAK